ncbi:MAG: hypothetical protein ACOC5K_00280 [Chloroflexota bacterium]
MAWSEAFQRALGLVLWWIIWLIAGGAMTAIGVGLTVGAGRDDGNAFLAVLGVLLAIAGYVVIILSGLAVLIRGLTDAIGDRIDESAGRRSR